MRITVLTHIDKESSKTHDVVVEQVCAALKKGKHAVSVLGVHADVKKLVSGLSKRKPDLVFNLMEMFGANVRGDVAAAGLLELMGFHFTGGGPGELFLRQDKALAKKVLAYDKVRCPDFAVFSKDSDMETGGNLRLPLFVKPLRADASIGIDGEKALCRTAKQMWKRVLSIHEDINDSALAEEFVEGREFYVGVLGNQNPTVLPPIEVDFSGLKDGALHVMDAKAKFDTKSDAFKGTKSVVADLPDELRAKLHKISLDAYRALRVRDYGRVDLRLTASGDLFVIEVNANCYLEQGSEFATAAAAAGMDYPTLINKIVELAAERHKQAM